MTIVYDPLTYRTLVSRPGELPYKFWSVNKLVIDAAAAGICTLQASDAAPSDTTKLWLDLTLPESAVGAVKAYSGGAWVALTPQLFYAHIAGGATGYVTDAEMTAYVSGIAIASTAISDATAAGRSMLTAANAAAQTALLSAFVGDSGSGGAKGLVPTPAAGDASKFLKGDGTFASIPGGGDALTANPLSQFAATTSAQLRGVLSDETGTGALVFGTAPTLSNPVVGTQTARDNSTKAASTAYVDSATREKLTANRTYYVRNNGSDSNNGLADTAGGAFLTTQHAMDVIATIDFGGYIVTVQLNDATFTGGCTVPVTVGQMSTASLIIQGNAATPVNVLVSTTSAHCFSVAAGARCLIKDMELRTTTSDSGIIAYNGGLAEFSNIHFGACATSHLYTAQGGQITCTGSYSIGGASPYHILSQSGSRALIASVTCTITGTPAFSSAFAEADGLSVITSAGMTWSGAATGKRYNSIYNSVIQTFGSGATYFPGGTAGTTQNGGVYA